MSLIRSSTYECLPDCPSFYSDADRKCLLISACGSTEFRQLVQSDTYQCVVDCQSRLVAFDELTCTSSTCNDFQLTIHSSTRKCVPDCPSGLVTEEDHSLCWAGSCNGTAFKQAAGGTSTYFCVENCPTKIVTTTDRICSPQT